MRVTTPSCVPWHPFISERAKACGIPMFMHLKHVCVCHDSFLCVTTPSCVQCPPLLISKRAEARGMHLFMCHVCTACACVLLSMSRIRMCVCIHVQHAAHCACIYPCTACTCVPSCLCLYTRTACTCVPSCVCVRCLSDVYIHIHSALALLTCAMTHPLKFKTRSP